jgi:mRNA-degrading endonuclease toxin of MazEF toxin-antitoxin module
MANTNYPNIRSIKRGELYYVDLGDPPSKPDIAYNIVSKEFGFIHPCVVIAVHIPYQLVTIIPLTSNLYHAQPCFIIKPTVKNGLRNESLALCVHLRSIDVRRLCQRPLGELANDDFESIVDLLHDYICV